MNRIMFAVGIIMVIATALLLVILGTRELGSSLIVLSIIGITMIGASRVRIMK